MLFLFLVVLLLIFAAGAIRARALITSALWLAGVSALASILFFLYGARLVAVIELSVGAGLVTVLFVFAINIAGDDALENRPVPPLPFIAGLALLFACLLGWYVWPMPLTPVAPVQVGSVSTTVWQDRGLDLMVQVVLIFSGVLGLLGLLAEAKPPLQGSMAAEVLARRENELRTLDAQVLQIQEVEK